MHELQTTHGTVVSNIFTSKSALMIMEAPRNFASNFPSNDRWFESLSSISVCVVYRFGLKVAMTAVHYKGMPVMRGRTAQINFQTRHGHPFHK